jgi:Aerotolerance regulator N-terminal/von Willebrand factor type A domain
MLIPEDGYKHATQSFERQEQVVSFLYPIFFAGLAAVGVPIVLHMIRRRTHKQQLFSSLMFLRESRPRFQSRSKIEHWLLLALRCLILGLLAWGFARPFLAKPIESIQSGSVSRKVILLDTSASMRREGVWQEALKRVSSVLDDIKIEDRICILRFDGEVRSVLNFEQWEALEPTQREYLAAEQIQSLAPSWQPTYLDAGLMGAVKALEEDEIHTQRESVESKEIILISDLQQGARLDLLHTFQWPEDVTLEVESVAAEKKTNATLNLLANKKLFSRAEETLPPRVRIHNSADADRSNFALEWNEPATESKTGRMDVYVAPGQSVWTFRAMTMRLTIVITYRRRSGDS